ncbi:MAG: NADH-quinone oxidoreductase subunit A [Desulfobacterales bacterium]
MQPIDTSGALSPWVPGIFSLSIYGLAVLALVAVLLVISSHIGERRPSVEKLRPYESGVIPTGTARLRYPVHFYLVAIFFLIFDVEGAFIFSWAVSARELGWAGWFEIAFFIGMLLLGLVYIWKQGGLEWGPTLKSKRTTDS